MTPSLSLWLQNIKKSRYSYDSTEMVVSSSTPCGLKGDLFVNSRMVGVSLEVNWSESKIYFFMILMVAPWSTKVLGILILLMRTITTRFLGSPYLGGIAFLSIKSTSFPITWMVGGSLSFLLGFLMHNYLTILAYIGMSLIAWNKGILTHTFLYSWSKSN